MSTSTAELSFPSSLLNRLRICMALLVHTSLRLHFCCMSHAQGRTPDIRHILATMHMDDLKEICKEVDQVQVHLTSSGKTSPGLGGATLLHIGDRAGRWTAHGPWQALWIQCLWLSSGHAMMHLLTRGSSLAHISLAKAPEHLAIASCVAICTGAEELGSLSRLLRGVFV